MAERVTLYDIARELDISASTVSRVLNNSNLISDEKSRQIIDTAHRLGYEPRTVKKQRNRAILNIHLFLPPSRETFVHLFYDVAQLLEGIEEGFHPTMLNISTRINDGSCDFLKKKKTGQVDGCIFAFTRVDKKLKNELVKREIPYIHLNRKESPAHICYDNRLEMDKLVTVLNDKRDCSLRLCYLGFSLLPEVDEERYTGIVESCNNKGIPFGPDDRFSVNKLEELGPLLQELLNLGYNGVMAFNDMLAMAALMEFKALGVAVPGDISLTGLDNSPVQRILKERIDTIDFSVSLLGKKAARWLSHAIIDKDKSPCETIITGEYIKGDTV